SINRDALAEVPLRVHEADADERQAEVARFLAVIAGEHAEAARVDRQRLVKRELRGEIRDRAAADFRKVTLDPGVLRGACGLETRDRTIVMREPFTVSRRTFECVG